MCSPIVDSPACHAEERSLIVGSFVPCIDDFQRGGMTALGYESADGECGFISDPFDPEVGRSCGVNPRYCRTLIGLLHTCHILPYLALPKSIYVCRSTYVATRMTLCCIKIILQGQSSLLFPSAKRPRFSVSYSILVLKTQLTNKGNNSLASDWPLSIEIVKGRQSLVRHIFNPPQTRHTRSLHCFLDTCDRSDIDMPCPNDVVHKGQE